MANRRLLLLATPVAVLSLFTAACGTSSSDTASTGSSLQEKTIGISFPKYSVQAGPQLEIAVAKEEASKQGYTLLVDDPGTDQNKQVSVIQTWIQQGVGTIIVQPTATETLEDIAKQARAKGIKWVVYANKMENQDATLGFDHVQGGQLIADQAAAYIKDKLGGTAEVAILTFTSGPWARTRQQAIEDELAKAAPGAKIVARQDALSQTDGVKVTGPLLQAHPKLNVILAVEEDATEGAYQALVSAGHAKGDPNIFLAGIDGTLGVYKLLQEGTTMYRASAGLDLKAVGRGFVELPKQLWAGQSGDYSVKFELVTADKTDLITKYLAQYNQ